jgi:hypothetical protein
VVAIARHRKRPIFLTFPYLQSLGQFGIRAHVTR